MTEVEHRTRDGEVRFRVKVLDGGTPRQRLSVTAEYWVEDEGFSKVWGVIGRAGTRAIAEELASAEYPEERESEGTDIIYTE